MTSTLATQNGQKIRVGADAGGINTHYHDVGPRDGAPVLLLHGSGPGVSAWANWRLNMDALAAAGNRVLAPDLVGFGYTDRPDDVYYSLDTWSTQVFDFMDALNVPKAAIVGNSLGGRIALDMAHARPDRISRMVLMGSPGVGMYITEGLKRIRQYEPSLENMRELLIDCFAVDPAIITDDLVRTRYAASTEPGVFETYQEMFTERHGATNLMITEEQVQATDTRTLLIHGREDKVVPVEISWNMVRLLPDADLSVFARCGHWTQIERSHDFNACVNVFLAGS